MLVSAFYFFFFDFVKPHWFKENTGRGGALAGDTERSV